MPVQQQMQARRGTAASWVSTNPILSAGEIGFESDTQNFKIGNGTTVWVELPYSSDFIATALPMQSGLYYRCTDTIVSGTTAANVAECSPLVVNRTTTFDQIGINLTLTGARVVAFAIYDNNDTGPRNLLFDGSNDSYTGPGFAGKTISPAITLNPGIYWLAFRSTTSGNVPSASSFLFNGLNLPNAGVRTTGYALPSSTTFPSVVTTRTRATNVAVCTVRVA